LKNTVLRNQNIRQPGYFITQKTWQRMSSWTILLLASITVLSADRPLTFAQVAAATGTAGIEKAPFQPDQTTLPAPVPGNAIVLLDEETNRFVSMTGEPINWPNERGVITSTRSGGRVNHIVSTVHFRDADIHVEFMVAPEGEGNSGIYIHGHYELQIFNSWGKPDARMTEHDHGALYGFQKPTKNASREPGEWQVYDIRYRAPRRDEEGIITEPGSVTAWLNGILVQENTRFEEPRSVYHPFRYGATDYLKPIAVKQKQEQRGPVFLQDHESPTKFRNVWIVPLDDKALTYAP
jgi:hypothetical protein